MPNETMLDRATAAAYQDGLGLSYMQARDIARAVIASLRDNLPDDVAMAGVMHDYSLEAAWRAMIDAILAEGEKTDAQ